MRTIGLDYGDRWLGIAVSDAEGHIAYPLEVAEGAERALDRLEEIIAEKGAGRIVLGLPRNMDGSLGRKAQEVLRFAEILRERFPVPVETWDERLTTLEAERYLRESGGSRRRRKEKVNQVAAQILLQSYLDSRRSPPAEPAPGDREEGEGDSEEAPPG